MGVILYMAMSLNGMIARDDDSTDWISETEWNSYSKAVRNAGCLIVGRRTYEILTKQPEFSEFKDVEVVVISNNTVQLVGSNHSIASSPKEALERLSSYNTIIVAGGAMINTIFLEQKLIDDIFIDIEPIILAKGIPLLSQANIEVKMDLINTKKLSENIVQLHYKLTSIE